VLVTRELDMLFVMEQGRIVHAGTHKQLIEAKAKVYLQFMFPYQDMSAPFHPRLTLGGDRPRRVPGGALRGRLRVRMAQQEAPWQGPVWRAREEARPSQGLPHALLPLLHAPMRSPPSSGSGLSCCACGVARVDGGSRGDKPPSCHLEPAPAARPLRPPAVLAAVFFS
jgi:hypothetical protein